MKMETHAATMAFPAEKRVDDITQNFWFRAGVFVLSVAVGFLFARLLHAGFALLPALGDGATGKASPLVAVLKLLRSGLGN
jgi:hypothetical protein